MTKPAMTIWLNRPWRYDQAGNNDMTQPAMTSSPTWSGISLQNNYRDILSRVSLFCWYLPVQKNSLFFGCWPQKQLLIQKNAPFLGQHDLRAPNERPVSDGSQLVTKRRRLLVTLIFMIETSNHAFHHQNPATHRSVCIQILLIAWKILPLRPN